MKAQESGIEFDFTSAVAAVRHDESPPKGEGNKVWPGVDFRVDEGSRELWIEVKSWVRKKQAEQIAADREFPKALASEDLRMWIVDKFLGTTAYLAWTGAFVARRVLYVIVLDSPRRDRTALLGAFSQRLRASFPKTHPWTHPVVHLVTDLETFQTQFVQYPCRRV